ncbi:MAG: 4-hydroxy-tetrahydrodipicolinate reductase [Armatimonadota bacterium]
MSDIRVGVCGFLGRMGAEVVRAVSEADGMIFAGGADPQCQGDGPEGAFCSASVEEMLREAHPEVVVDFTVPAAAAGNIRAALEAGAHCVVGTTGIPEDERERLGDLARSRGLGLLIAPNFAMGAVLMMRFAQEAARFFQGAEIIELHHDRKLDAPSGTALMTADRIASSWSGSPGPGVGEPSRGLDRGGVQIHSVRMPGFVAHQEVVFGNPGEVLTIRHDSLDRKSFMPGVILAIRRIREHRGLLFGLEALLFD